MKTIAFFLALSLAFACNKEAPKDERLSTQHEPSPETLATAAPFAGNIDLVAAQAMFNERCAACHGVNGDGKGPASAALNPKPRNYTDKAWQASVTDEQLRKTIVLGGAGIGKSPMMPGSPDLDEKPEVVEGLVKIIRKIGN